MIRKKYKQNKTFFEGVYNSPKISKFINYLMKKGKKTTGQSAIYGALKIIEEKTKKDPIEIFELALRNVGPVLEVKSKRIGGATYQVPVKVKKERRDFLAMNWLIEAGRKKKGKTIQERLAEELLLAADNQGTAVKKKENVYRMAEANRAFAHFAQRI